MPAPKIFKDPSQQKLFNKQGFVVMPSFLKQSEIEHMDALFDELHPNLPQNGFFAGVYSSDFSYKEKVKNEVKRVYQRAYETVFENYTSFGGAFLFKSSAPDSDLFVHQDWTVVDEEKEVALNIWIPLCDMTLENGPLMVLPGSHYDAFKTLRAPTMRFFFDNDPNFIIDQLEPLVVKAGDAVILNQSLVHYSPPNVSGKIRKAITAGIKTKDAQMIFHYKGQNSNAIEKFEMDDDFFIQFDDFFKDIYQRPKVGKSIGTINYTVPMVTGNALVDVVRTMKTNAGFNFKEPIVASVSDSNSVSKVTKKKTPLWKTYSPLNVFNEIKVRLKK